MARFFCGAGSCISLFGYSSIARLSSKRDAAHRTVVLAWWQVMGFLFGCLLSVGIFATELAGFSSLFDRGNVHALGLIAVLLVLLASLLIPQRTETKFVYQLYERSVTPNSIIEEDEEQQRGSQVAMLNNEEIYTLLAIYSAGTAAAWGVLGAHLQMCTQHLDDNIYAVFASAAVIALTPKLVLKYLSRASTRGVMGSIVLIAAGCLGFSDVTHSTLLPQAIVASVLLFVGLVCLVTQVPVALLHVASIPYYVILLAVTTLVGRLGGLLVGVAVVTAANVEAVTRLGTAFVFMGLLTGFVTLRPSPPRVEQEASANQGTWLNQEL